MVGIYKICSPSDKVYIGQSINIEKRFRYYNTNIKTLKQQRKLNLSFQKYTPQNHIFEVIEECSIELLDEREIYWIEYYDAINNGLNIAPGGRGGSRLLNIGKTHKQDTIDKMKKWWDEHKEPRPQDVIDKIKETKRNNPRITTDEHRLKYRETAPNKKTVIQYSLDNKYIAEYKSINEAARVIDGSKDGISFCCNGRQNTSGGYIWKFK